MPRWSRTLLGRDADADADEGQKNVNAQSSQHSDDVTETEGRKRHTVDAQWGVRESGSSQLATW